MNTHLGRDFETDDSEIFIGELTLVFLKKFLELEFRRIGNLGKEIFRTNRNDVNIGVPVNRAEQFPLLLNGTRREKTRKTIRLVFLSEDNFF